MVRRRFSDIVDAAPDELSQAEGVMQVFCNKPLQAVRAPAGIAVSQGGTLLIRVAHDALAHRKMIDSPAGQDAAGFASVDNPFRVGSMMRFI